MQAHILIVDDEEAIRRMMVRALQFKGYDTSEAATALAALKIAQQTPVDLVLTDLVMPGMGGLELAQKLIAHDPLLPVIIMSAYGELGDIRQAIDIGASDYLVKPFDLKDALSSIDQAIERRLAKIPSQDQSSQCT